MSQDTEQSQQSPREIARKLVRDYIGQHYESVVLEDQIKESLAAKDREIATLQEENAKLRKERDGVMIAFEHDRDCAFMADPKNECDCWLWLRVQKDRAEKQRDALAEAEQEAERLRATVAYIAAWKLYDEDQRQKTDDMAGAYETAITLCRAALAPQPTKAQEPTLEQLEREYREACVRNNFGPSAECSARWEELQAKRKAIDAARKEAGEKP